MANRDWAELKPLIQQAWPSVPEPQLDATGGDRDALIEVIRTQAGLDATTAEAQLDALLGDDDAPSGAGAKGSSDAAAASGLPLQSGAPSNAANAGEGTAYAEGEQGTSGIGQEGTPAADASASNEQEQRRAS
jgi:hypothetical protein